MKLRNKFIILIVLIVLISCVILVTKNGPRKENGLDAKEVRPVLGNIKITVETTGTILPKNRLEILPTVAGRIEKIYVNEGDKVKAGQVLALMSSTDRAALIDAARLQGDKALRYWKEAYKPIQIVSPINGTIIVRSIEKGQTVTTSDAILVISDKLIVKAQVDETDIGKVVVGQDAYTTLDSHPEILVKGKVTHIYYESTTVSNVTVYYVIITPDKIPPEFRSGMSSTIEIVQQERKNVLLLPQEAVRSDGNQKYVMIKNKNSRQFKRSAVTVGNETGNNIEITGGISKDDVILVQVPKIIFDKSSESSSNPFMPQRPKRKNK